MPEGRILLGGSEGLTVSASWRENWLGLGHGHHADMSLIGRIREQWRYWRRLIRDPRTPRWSRWLLILACAYLVTPVDLIPDWIPGLGWVDDLVVVPLLVFLALRGIPRSVRQELRHH